jgi:outer membrane protein assembly factor BamB
MVRRSLIAALIIATLTPLVGAVITAPTKLSAFMKEADHILVAKIESLNAEKGTIVLTVDGDLKGKLESRRLNVAIRPDQDAIKGDHIPQLLKRLAPGLPLVLFITRDKEVAPAKEVVKCNAFTNGTWMQLLGFPTEKDRFVWTLTHGEPFLRKMYKGTTAEMVTLLKDVLAGKAKAPELDKTVEPGFGPELPAKSTQRATPLSPGTPGERGGGEGVERAVNATPPRETTTPLTPPSPPEYRGRGSRLQHVADNASDSTVHRSFASIQTPAPFAVIPTIGIAGPLAILAILFPTVFGGVLILFRQWTAFIAMFSINSMLYLLYWWRGAAWLDESWWGSNLGVWTVFTAVTLVCTLWAWRRQLYNLAQGADSIETPARTEFLVLGVLTLTCLAFIAGTWFFDPPQRTDLVWNMTLVLTAGIVVGLLYKAYRSLVEVMLPMATEGVMLGTSSLASLAVFVLLAGAQAAAVDAPRSVVASADGASELVREKWTFRSKREGLFASSPIIVGNHVYAASSHPTFGYGYVYRLDLETGEKQWTFGGGSYKRPISTPVFAEGRIYIGEGWHGDPSCSVFCINAADGEKVWDFPTANQTEATPAVDAGKVYTGCGNDGFRCLTAGDAGKGKEIWRFPKAGAGGRLLRFASGAAVGGGKVYVGTGVDRDQADDQGETALFCLDAATGQQIWKIPMPHPVWTTPVLNHGQLFLAIGNGDVFTDAPEPAGAIFCLNPETGATIWKLDLPNSILQEPSVDKHRLYLGCRDGGCYAIDRKKGEIAWKVNLGGPIIGTPALAISGPNNDAAAVYAVSSAGRVACLAPESGLSFWTTSYENKDLVFIAAPAVVTRPSSRGGSERLLVLGAGHHDTDTGKFATLICIEDRSAAK